MSEFSKVAQEDGWEVGDFPGALESAAIEAIAWKLLDLTMDAADREPSKVAVHGAMATGERILAGLLADAAEAEQRAANAEAERDRYAEREEAFSRGLRVADAGRYRADWPGAVETTIRRAERAEAELAALRERMEQVTEAAYGAIADEQMLTILPTEHGAKVPPHWRAQAEARATLTVADLQHLLDDDTTGAASGEGEK